MQIGDLVRINKSSAMVGHVGKVGLVVRKVKQTLKPSNTWLIAFSDGSTVIFHRVDLLEVPNENRRFSTTLGLWASKEP
jgi:hypothetical protein